MKESLALFEEIMKMKVFAKTPIFVFLNKKDLFEEMITHDTRSISAFQNTMAPREISFLLYSLFSASTLTYKKYRGENDDNLFVQILAARVRMDMKVAFTEVEYS